MLNSSIVSYRSPEASPAYISSSPIRSHRC